MLAAPESKTWLVAASLLVFCLLGYGATLGGALLSDDYEFLLGAASARGPIDAFQVEGRWSHLWWRPLGALSWWVVYLVAGTESVAHRSFSLLAHFACCFALWALARRLLVDGKSAWIAAAAFAVNPQHTEAVTWCASRFDVLSALGTLLALIGMHDWLRGGRRASLAVVASGTLVAVLSKETGALTPVLLVGLFLALRRETRSSLRRGLPPIAISGLLALAYTAVRHRIVGGVGGLELEVSSLGVARLTLEQFSGFAIDAVQGLALPAPWIPNSTPFAVLALVCLAAGATLAHGRVWPWGKLLAPCLLLGLSLSPYIVWHRVNYQGAGSRYFYLASAFTCMCLAAPLAGAWRRPRTIACLVAAVLTIWTVGLMRANQPWRQAARLAGSLVAALPEPGDGVEVVLVTGLPDNVEGAYVFRNAFSMAMQLADFPVRVVELERADWERRWAQNALAPDTRRSYRRFDHERRAWVDHARGRPGR